MAFLDPDVFAEADFLYFGADMDSQGIVRAITCGPLHEVLRTVAEQTPGAREHIYITVGERSWRSVDGRQVETVRPQYALGELPPVAGGEEAGEP